MIWTCTLPGDKRKATFRRNCAWPGRAILPDRWGPAGTKCIRGHQPKGRWRAGVFRRAIVPGKIDTEAVDGLNRFAGIQRESEFHGLGLGTTGAASDANHRTRYAKDPQGWVNHCFRYYGLKRTYSKPSKKARHLQNEWRRESVRVAHLRKRLIVLPLNDGISVDHAVELLGEVRRGVGQRQVWLTG